MVSSHDIPLITTETLQYRLDTQNFGKSGGQRSSLTRCAQKYGTFRAELSSKTPDAEVIEKCKNDLVREVELFGLEISKLILWQHNLERKASLNEMAEAERERKITQMKQKVDDSRELANKSLEQQNCLAEYESLAKVINENHPTSSIELQKQIDEIQTEISNLEDASAKTDEIINVREVQYQLLIQYMMDLKQALKEDQSKPDSQEGDEGSKGENLDDVPQPMDIDNLYGDL
mmetsp:Transcript_12143/g.28813  ORF Transcript_12143/g.28813 Transcript_12143/m.28813 type:complete len:233 (-) Transcript_12143:1451-2149(-)|eukprot:CAMPEP_0197189056 /NCGR_PEP_ID=MMETSP1423-20130617/19053_1 /TAXON_ID=476441 /ORGANISM="Pseudo-nitzschia heimii, Strain UNC1101" /LENGTH=232 /DNA_ID=CAMNT_0042641071 /DNA_START=86 /DNA_END=787 /DNA_ORIENTATION=-